MDLTRHGLDQAEDPIKTQSPEEEEQHENGATKMFRKVRAKAKQIRNSITKHGQIHEHDNDVNEEDDENDEQESEKHDSPVNESSSSAVKAGVTVQPEFLSHGPGTDVPAPEEITPPGTKVSPVVSSHYTKPVEPEPLRDTSYGHELPSPPLIVSDHSDREESREGHHKPMDTPASLLAETEDVTRTSAHGEDEYIEGQQRVKTETPKRLEEDPSHVSGVTNPTQEGDGKAGIVEIDESRDHKSGLGFERDLPSKSNGFERESDSGIEKDSPARFEDESGIGPKKSHEFDQKSESGIGNDTGFGEKPGTEIREDFLAKSNEFDQEIKSEIGKDSPSGFDGESRTGQREDLPAKSNEFDQKMKPVTVIEKDTELCEKPGTEMRGDFLRKNNEFDQEIEAGIGKDSPTGLGGESETGLGEEYPARSDDVEVETVLGKESNDQFSPGLSHPKESDNSEKIGSTTSFITDKAIGGGYSGETIFEKVQESPVEKVEGTIAEKLTSVKEKEKDKGVSARDHLAEKLTTGQRDKAVSDVIAEKLNLGGDKKTTTTKQVDVMVEKRFGSDWKIISLTSTIILFFAVSIAYFFYF